MGSPTHIQVRADETGLLGMKQTPEAAAKVSALLQEDMEVRPGQTAPLASQLD